MAKTIKRTIQILKFNFKEILLFEVLYRLITGVIFLSMATRGISLAIKYSGYSYLTAKNIGLFLIRPLTLLVLLVMTVVGVAILVVESAALLAAFQASERCEKLPAHYIFIRGIKKCSYYLKKGNFYIVSINLLMIVIVHYPVLSKGLSHIKQIGDWIKNLGQSTWGSALILLLAVLAVAVVLPGLYTMHFGLLNHESGREAWRKSWYLISRNAFSAVLHIFFLNVGMYLVLRLALLVLGFLAALIIYHFVSKSITLALLLTAYEWLEIGSLFTASSVNMILNMALLTGIYYTGRDKTGMAPELLIPDEDREEDYRSRKTWTVLAIMMVFFFGCFLYDTVENGIRFAKEALVETEITAHRGSSVEAPENTLAAIELAIEQMADYVEIDVQETMDGEVILLHDKSFKRTCGVSKNPWNMTLSQVKLLNAAAYMKDYEETEVPTLREVLECCRDQINLNIELKSNGHDPELPDKVVELIREYDMENQCVFTSSSMSFLKRVKELDEDLKTGYILSTAYGEFYKDDAVDFLSVNSVLLDEKNMALIHENGREIHAWTVNSKQELERLKHLGVDNIITDYPVLTREILYREEDTEGFLEFLSIILK
ncbi:MAG: glycerophosphoryl diester phosphodiesterase membrane domain-containing protein [Lachnospiraceae bacterium]|nr:glycerophosphoryl diester phosphodiesterase membrane domain-containing protein [Lachnospiraceae bacterium]